MPSKRPAKLPTPTKSTISAVISDIHFPVQDKKCWSAFKQWVSDIKPHNIYVNGDIFDFEMLSTFSKNKDTEPHIVDEMREGIVELNWLKKQIKGDMTIIFGNHEDRWARKISEVFGLSAKGLKGLGLQDQLYAQGLDPSIKIKLESIHNIGEKIGQFLIRHGDKQSGRYGGGKNIAAGRVEKTLGTSEIVGHHHIAQLSCKSFDDRLAIGIVNPCLTGAHSYAVSASWQQGFTILDQASNGWVTPYIVIMYKGMFSWSGKTYKGV